MGGQHTIHNCALIVFYPEDHSFLILTDEDKEKESDLFFVLETLNSSTQNYYPKRLHWEYHKCLTENVYYTHLYYQHAILHHHPFPKIFHINLLFCSLSIYYLHIR